MAKKSLTIKEVKDKKTELEIAILKLVQDFEKECGVYASYVHFNRKNDYEERPTKADGPEKRGPVENVDMNMELDLIY